MTKNINASQVVKKEGIDNNLKFYRHNTEQFVSSLKS